MSAVAKRALILVFAALLAISSVAFAVPDTLEFGDEGDDVVALQTQLMLLDLYDGEATGIFDKATEDAVRRLQALRGVAETGVFTPALLDEPEAEDEDTLGEITDELIEASATNLGILHGYTIGIDPGHQTNADTGLEQISPNSVRTKYRMTRGTSGIKTGVQECAVNLQIALKLDALLTESGAAVVLTRTENDVMISNAERAQLMNQADVDLWIRLHCDQASSQRVSGAYVIIPTRSAAPDIYAESLSLARCVLQNYCASTGAEPLAIRSLWNQTGFNWSEKPVVTLEMGYLSNPQEDVRLSRDSYQQLCAVGVYNGVVAYIFSE